MGTRALLKVKPTDEASVARIHSCDPDVAKLKIHFWKSLHKGKKGMTPFVATKTLFNKLLKKKRLREKRSVHGSTTQSSRL